MGGVQMNYQSVADTAKAWNLSERTVRNYCASGKIRGQFLPARHGTFRRTQSVQSASTKSSKRPAPCSIFCRTR